MAGPLIPLILLSLVPVLTALPATLPIAVLVHPEDDPLQLAALNYAVRHINMDSSILPKTELKSVIVNVSQTDSFSTGKKVCSLAREGIAAIFGPRASSTTGIVQSISETLEIPNLQTYSEVPEYPSRCLINVHPTPETIAKSFTVIYDTDEGLLRLQEVLKAHGPGDEPVTVRQFLPGDDQRQLLKEIYASQETHILLECATDRIVEILKQAREVKMMGDYHSYFITSLDTHTLDLTLVDPENPVVKNRVNMWKDWEQYYKNPINLMPETLPTEIALLHDAMFLFAHNLHKLFTPDKQFSVSTLACDDDDTWAHGFAIAKKELKGNERYMGYSMDLITEVANQLNFQFEFRLVPNNKHAELVDDLENRRISILYSKPVKEEPRLFAFLDPFSIDVWIYVATAYLGVSILLFVLARISPGEWDNPHPCNPDPEELENNFNLLNCLWFSIGSLMGQGCDILPKAVSTRMVAGMWWFFTLIMISSYTANLAAFLTLNRMDSTISSAEDLAKQYKIKMWTVMSQTRPSVFVKNNEEGVERVRKAKGMYAFFMESISIEHQVERKCDLTQVGGLLDSKGYGIGLPLNSPYRTVISGAVLKLQERGMLEELKARWWKVRDGISCSALEAESAKADSNELGLDNVGGVFVVLIAGTLAAFLMAILELLWNCRKIAVEEKISPCEALASELKFAVNCANANKPVRKKDESDEEEEEEGEGGPRFQKFNDKD
ncbi:hypothetical protein C0J52_17537 [Blattella germanica]|nr:hypothetical protein C0J52_17537 [Blattella germanica]